MDVADFVVEVNSAYATCEQRKESSGTDVPQRHGQSLALGDVFVRLPVLHVRYLYDNRMVN